MRKLFVIFVLHILAFNLSGQSLEEQLIVAIGESQKGNTEQAIAIYDGLIKEYPDAPMLYVLKGEAQSKIKQSFSVEVI